MTTWVLLRGLAREARHWGPLLPLLRERLPAGDRVLAIDLPGNGSRWREASPLHVDGMVAAARAAVAGAGAEGPVRVLALSLGGMVAVRWAERFPREIAGCVLINTSLARFSAPWERLRPASYPALLRALAARDAHAREAVVIGLTSNRPADAGFVAEWARHARECPLARVNVLRQLAAAARFRAPLQPPPVPLLLLAARGDRLVAPACSQAIARAWCVPLHLHPWGGHDLALDDPGWVVAHVLAWNAPRRSRHDGAGAARCHPAAIEAPRS